MFDNRNAAIDEAVVDTLSRIEFLARSLKDRRAPMVAPHEGAGCQVYRNYLADLQRLECLTKDAMALTAMSTGRDVWDMRRT